MKTLMKTVAALAGVLVVSGCAATAQEPTPPQAYGPGWRHQQMMAAWQDGKAPPAPMMMMRGRGPGMMAVGPDGKIDLTKLPPGCPYAQAQQPGPAQPAK
ncbi:MAG: hypothetical protein HY985_07980 [Magnetospirillum sp.]|nr:hypothetical protein [Magnetospirillum sp.]